MSVVEIKLTADQLAAAYTQLTEQEQRSFLLAIFDHPAQQQAALELLVAAQEALKRKFSLQQQRLLNNLLEKNAEGKLRPAQRRQLDELMAEYGDGLVEKARAQYILHLTHQVANANP